MCLWKNTGKVLSIDPSVITSLRLKGRYDALNIWLKWLMFCMFYGFSLSGCFTRWCSSNYCHSSSLFDQHLSKSALPSCCGHDRRWMFLVSINSIKFVQLRDVTICVAQILESCRTPVIKFSGMHVICFALRQEPSLRHCFSFTFFVAVPPLFVTEFLHRVMDTFEDYFNECTESAIKDNYVIVYEVRFVLLWSNIDHF